ncbi:MAG: TlpA family protein disulfide reductase, partial [Candidatus Aminicenantes bacterium]|nr:TlpA family protein disulfide reductase [Candidatus Aminicenantes bacterium]
MKKRTLFVLFLIVLVIASVYIYSCKGKKADSGSVPNIASAEPAPAFEVTTLDGKTITLDSLKGKVVLVNFWATWCPPCRAEIPDFIEAYSELKGQGLEILGFSVDD